MPALSLHVVPQELHDSTVEVSWCVSKEVVSELQQTPKDQRLPAWCFLIARAENERETRKLVPLHDGRAYINLPAPGAVRIFAVLLVGREVDVWAISLDRLKLGGWKSRWAMKSGDGIIYDRKCRPFVADHLDCDGDWAFIDVVVPDGVFGKRPSDREMTWLCMMISNVPEDECDVRRRRLFAYSVQPLFIGLLYGVVVAMIALRLLVVVALIVLLGVHGLDWSKWAAPSGFFSDRITSVFFRKGPVGLLLACLCPIWWLVLYVASPSWPAFIVAGASMVALFSVSAVAVAVFDYRRGQVQPVRRKLSPRVTLLDRVVCSELNPPVRRRSIRLYCAELKAKICRPVAGSAGAFPRDD